MHTALEIEDKNDEKAITQHPGTSPSEIEKQQALLRRAALARSNASPPPPEETKRSKVVLVTSLTSVTTGLGATSGSLLSLKSGADIVTGGLIGGFSGCFTGLCCFFSTYLVKKYFIDDKPQKAAPDAQSMEMPTIKSEQSEVKIKRQENAQPTLFARSLTTITQPSTDPASLKNQVPELNPKEPIDDEALERKYEFK